MSIPTFNSTELVSRAGRDFPGGVKVRFRAETLPGVDGQYVQLNGNGGREIIVRGVLEVSGDSPESANQALKSALRSKQALADGATVASYVGTDGSTYANCLLTDYKPAGDVQISPGESNYQALVFVEARMLQLVS